MAEKKSGVWGFVSRLATEGFANFLWAYWPVYGMPIAMAALGYVQGLPIAYIFLMALAAFALTAHALNHFSQWYANRTPENKARFGAILVGVKLDEKNTPSKLEGIKLGVSVQNLAKFPMEIRIDRCEVKLLDRVPKEIFTQRSIEVAIGGAANFSEALIDLANIELAGKVVPGMVNATVSYGRPGNLKYSITQDRHIAIGFDQNGLVSTIEGSNRELKI